MNIPSWRVTCNMHTRLECKWPLFFVFISHKKSSKIPPKKALFFGSQNLAAILRVKRIPPLNIGQRGFFQSMYNIKKWLEIFPRQVGSAIFDLCDFLCFFFFHLTCGSKMFFSRIFGRFFRWRSFFSDVLTSGGLSLKLLSLVTSLLPVASCTVTRPLPAATLTGSEGNTKTAWPWYSGFCFRCNHTCRWEKKVPPQRVENFWRAQGTASNAFFFVKRR